MSNDECKPESNVVPEEICNSEDIDHVKITPGFGMYPKSIRIYLKKGNYIEISPHMDISERGIVAQLKLTRGFWGKIDKAKE